MALSLPDSSTDNTKRWLLLKPAALPSDSGIVTGTAGPRTSVSDNVLGTRISYKENLRRLERLENHIKDLFSQSTVDRLHVDKRIQPVCVNDRCDPKMKTLVDQSKQTYEQFKKDKKSKLPYNEGQVHKYDKHRRLSRISEPGTAILTKNISMTFSTLIRISVNSVT
jgi:hypothetical protein